MQLRGKVALITGGGRGIGEAIATAYAQEGAIQVVAARTRAEIEAVAERLRTIGGESHAVVADVALEKSVDRLVQEVVALYGRVDVLVNCAGTYGPIGPMWEADPKRWIEALSVNLVGTFLCCRAVIPGMIERRAGKIIMLSGGGGTGPAPRLGAYAASKAAVVRLAENLAEEVREYGIQVNAIAPGLVDSRLQDQVLEAGERAGELLTRIRGLRMDGVGGVGAEVAARLAVFLASSASDGLSGRLIAAPHDGWEKWDNKLIGRIMAAPWFQLRRMDPFTLKALSDGDLHELSSRRQPLGIAQKHATSET